MRETTTADVEPTDVDDRTAIGVTNASRSLTHTLNSQPTPLPAGETFAPSASTPMPTYPIAGSTSSGGGGGGTTTASTATTTTSGGGGGGSPSAVTPNCVAVCSPRAVAVCTATDVQCASASRVGVVGVLVTLLCVALTSLTSM